MASTGALRRIGLGMAAVMVASLFLGGCSAQKKREEALKAEAQECAEKNAALEQSLRDKDSRITELEGRLSAMQTAAVQPQPSESFSKPFSSNTGGGGSGDFSRDEQGNMRARISGDVLFASGQATLRPEAKKTLDRIAAQIKRDYANDNVRVEGYTDSDPIRKSKFASNQALSEARAQAVETYLVQKGISSRRVQAVGYGSSKPKGTKAASRRVEIVILN